MIVALIYIVLFIIGVPLMVTWSFERAFEKETSNNIIIDMLIDLKKYLTSNNRIVRTIFVIIMLPVIIVIALISQIMLSAYEFSLRINKD